MKKPKNRMQTDLSDREDGKPPLEPAPKPEPIPAHPVVLHNRVPPQNCPHCGRGMQPRVKRRENRGAEPYADCGCALCGKPFRYVFPRVERR